MHRLTPVCVLVLLGGVLRANAQPPQPLDLPARLHSAERVVVATIVAVRAALERNGYGDELIISHATVRVDETLKGSGSGSMRVAVEGGTLNGLTLRVSDMPQIQVGERAVLLVDAGSTGVFVPHLRGLGILKLDAADRVQRSSLTLDDIRRMASSNPQ